MKVKLIRSRAWPSYNFQLISAIPKVKTEQNIMKQKQNFINVTRTEMVHKTFLA